MVYLDDIIIIGNDEIRIRELKAQFQTKDLIAQKFFLGIGVIRIEGKFF